MATGNHDHRRVDGRGTGGAAECHLLATTDVTHVQDEGHAGVLIQDLVSGAGRNATRSR